MVQIRTATKADIPIIRQLAEKTWWPVYSPILEKEQIEYMLAHIYSADAMAKVMDDGSQVFLLLFEAGEAKGFASYGLWSERPDAWKIHKLYVLPECHGKGFGKKLVDEINGLASAKQINTLVLNVNRHNPAFHFYQRLGFTILRKEDIPVGPYWMNDFVMTVPVK